MRIWSIGERLGQPETARLVEVARRERLAALAAEGDGAWARRVARIAQKKPSGLRRHRGQGAGVMRPPGAFRVAVCGGAYVPAGAWTAPDAAQARLPGIEVGHSCVAHRACDPDPVTSLGPTWATATGWDTVEDWVGARLSSRWGAAEGADFDQEGLCAEVREVVNDNLPAGWTLEEDHFVGPTPIPEDALEIVRATIDAIDFWGMAQYYDNGD